MKWRNIHVQFNRFRKITVYTWTFTKLQDTIWIMLAYIFRAYVMYKWCQVLTLINLVFYNKKQINYCHVLHRSVRVRVYVISIGRQCLVIFVVLTTTAIPMYAFCVSSAWQGIHTCIPVTDVGTHSIYWDGDGSVTDTYCANNLCQNVLFKKSGYVW